MAQEKSNILMAIKELRDREPYVPFTIVVSSGDRYTIEAPQNLVEMASEFFYAFPGGERFVFIRTNQIVAVERPEHGERRRKRKSA